MATSTSRELRPFIQVYSNCALVVIHLYVFQGRETSRLILQGAIDCHSKHFSHTPDIGINKFYAVERHADDFYQRLFDHTKIHDERMDYITKEIIRQERGDPLYLTSEEREKLFDK